jgi:hypothetical protein
MHLPLLSQSPIQSSSVRSLGLTAGVEKGSGHRGREGLGAGCRERWNGGDARPRPRGAGGGRPRDDALAGDFTGITPEMKAKLQRGEASRGSDLIACAAAPMGHDGAAHFSRWRRLWGSAAGRVPCPGGVRRSWWRFSQWQHP